MKINLKKILLFSIQILTQIVFSQTKEYNKVAFDKEDLPLPEVNITVKGTDRVTQTDFDRKFNIKVPDSLPILTFNYIDFENLFA